MICWKMVHASDYGILPVMNDTFMNQRVLFALDNVVEQLSALHVLHYQEQLFGGFDDFVELDYVRVADQLEDVDLA